MIISLVQQQTFPFWVKLFIMSTNIEVRFTYKPKAIIRFFSVVPKITFMISLSHDHAALTLVPHIPDLF